MSRTVVLLVIALGGCLLPAQGPHSGAVASGQQLAVVDDVKVWTTTKKEKVAEAEYKDSRGATIATAAVYEDRTKVHTQKIWYPVQGTEQLSDEDFFRIAGDQKALDETLRMRAEGKTWRRRGMFTMAGGIVGVIASYFVSNTTGRTLLLAGGGLVVGGGYYMSYWGAHKLNPETHAVDRSIAERAALQYNQQLGTSVGVNMTRTF